MAFVRNLFNGNARELARLRRTADQVNALESKMQVLSDSELSGKTLEFRSRLDAGELLDAMLPEVFAVCREAGKRVLGMRHFDVQIMGGQVLHEGKVAEMRTGEGKTLVGTLAVYANALSGKGAHVVTVNEYLAKRDAEWMAPLYQFLGLSVGVIQNALNPSQRREAYRCDITYVTNNELGFDYLRDNMAWNLEDMVLRELHFATIDEVDSILIDESRTPLIISGPGHAAQTTDLYEKFAKIVPRLNAEDDVTIDQKAHSAAITETGVAKVERMLGITNLYDQRNLELTHQLNAALKAWHLFHRDQQYIVKDGEVVIVDEFTGRLMYGRRYSDGIHQAIEAKEGLEVKAEDQTLATITFQNFFRLYTKLGGMTGTAKTEEREFRDIYGLDVVPIPTNLPVKRIDHPDVVFKTEIGKFNAVVEDIVSEYKMRRPVLVGTRSIEKSERLAEMLRAAGVPCNVLNAKYHEQEAQIIKDAGQLGAVTIATNMAGRGVDIKLGEGVQELGGLHILGTERHESRRIDNQLRGRSGRQGDPGSTRFYISLEDELMRLFGGERLQALFSLGGLTDDARLEDRLLTRSIESAQRKIENHNYEIRKQVLEYDDVMNKQREVIYAERRKVLEGTSLRDFMLDTIVTKANTALNEYAPENVHHSEWDIEGLINEVEIVYPVRPTIALEEFAKLERHKMQEKLVQIGTAAYEAKEAEVNPELMRVIESRYIMLPIMDRLWVDHLYIMDALKSGIGLRGYGQRDPRVEYEKEAYEIFEDLKSAIADEAIKAALHVVIEVQEEPVAVAAEPASGTPDFSSFVPVPSGLLLPQPTQQAATLLGPPPTNAPKELHTNREAEPSVPAPRQYSPGRNELCSCGSGKKYKKCHGAA